MVLFWRNVTERVVRLVVLVRGRDPTVLHPPLRWPVSAVVAVASGGGSWSTAVRFFSRSFVRSVISWILTTTQVFCTVDSGHPAEARHRSTVLGVSCYFLVLFFFLAFNTLAQTVPWAAVCVHRNFVAKHKSDDDGTVVAELNAVSSWREKSGEQFIDVRKVIGENFDYFFSIEVWCVLTYRKIFWACSSGWQWSSVISVLTSGCLSVCVFALKMGCSGWRKKKVVQIELGNSSAEICESADDLSTVLQILNFLNGVVLQRIVC